MSETSRTTSGNLPPAQPPASNGMDPSGAAPTPERKRRGGFARFVKWAVALILLLLIGAGVVIYVYLDPIVKRTVEKQATAQLNLKTELDRAHVSLFGGQVDLNQLRIASPQGFQAPQMFTL